MRKVRLALLACLAVAGCNGSDGGDTSLITEFVVLDKFEQEATTFTAGEEITLMLKVTNPESSPVDISYTEPGYGYTVFQGETEVWRAFAGISWPQVVQTYPIENAWTMPVVWNGVDADGDPLPAGDYFVEPDLAFFVDGRKLPIPDGKTITIIN